jgi:hypothetical protein
MVVVALPNQHYPPDGAALARADFVIGGLDELPELASQWLRRG